MGLWNIQRVAKAAFGKSTHCREIVGLFKNYDFHQVLQVESLETPLVDMSPLSVNYWLTKICLRGGKAFKRALPSENLVQRHCCWYLSLSRREETG